MRVSSPSGLAPPPARCLPRRAARAPVVLERPVLDRALVRVGAELGRRLQQLLLDLEQRAGGRHGGGRLKNPRHARVGGGVEIRGPEGRGGGRGGVQGKKTTDGKKEVHEKQCAPSMKGPVMGEPDDHREKSGVGSKRRRKAGAGGGAAVPGGQGTAPAPAMALTTPLLVRERRGW